MYGAVYYYNNYNNHFIFVNSKSTDTPCRGIRVLYGSESLFAILVPGNQSVFLCDHSQWLVLPGKTIGCLHKSCRICCYRNYTV